MKYAVLGSHGQIGSHLSIHLRNQGHEVLNFDIALNPRHDLRSVDATYEAIENVDFVFFLAFDVGGSSYLKTYQNTYKFIENNIQIMENTFGCLHDLDKPFIFASSQMSNMSFSCYGALKCVGEYYCKSLRSPIVKFWNVYGVERDPQKTHVITDFVKMAVKDEPIVMRTTGQEERQFLYSDDCSEALYILSQRYDDLSRKEEYHVTTFDWVTVRTVAEIISRQCGGTEIIAGTAVDNVQQGRHNEPSPLIRQYWEPKIFLEEGISHIIYYEKESLNAKPRNSVPQ